MRREINKYNSIILGITRSLEAVAQASTGGSVPGDGTEEVISAVNLGHTPASWRALCKHPTPGTLHAFLQDFHARVDFFRTWLNNGCPKTYWLGAFQFLPAFLTIILRQVGQSTRRPLHHLSWGFHLTDEPPPEMPEFMPSDAEEEDTKDGGEQVDREEGEKETEEASVPEEGGDDEKATQGDGGDKEEEKEEETETGKTAPEEPEEKVWPISTKESRADWNALGSDGLVVHGMWLVGAAWNVNKKELEEPSSQELIQKLPLLSMIPTPTVLTGSYTMRGAHSLCTTARSQPSLHRQSSTTLTESEGPGEAAEGPEPPASDRPSTDDHPNSEAHQTRFSDEFQNIKDSTSLDLHLGEETLPSNRSDVLSTARSRYYECPVYEGGPSSSANQMPVLNITLPAGAKGGNHWVQRRVAIYLSRY
ncbi:uncharacterized protein LOC125033707 [Penaeus chinensis]|uniref:uncharacterized protein LOC125033707 n=1 Tax=Penaeus chinensis TaxID=139456 RepID=UPI001FB60840|nr:uncharacterized protein LOC125033707 [Penaeus chinensis]